LLKVKWRCFNYINIPNKLNTRLLNSPQARGIVKKPRITTPRKPNSARRSIVKVNLLNSFTINSYIPGIGHNLRKHSLVLIRGGGCRDLPGVNYTCIRGVFDFLKVQNRFNRRSIYGVPRPDHLKFKIRRKFRQY
jgi:small subunit ribosomal protein S12